MTTLATALSGLLAAGRRVEAVAQNVAGASATGGPDGSGAYRPVDVRQTAMPDGGVAASVVPRSPAFVTIPDANGGVVDAPNVDLASEMVDLVGARLAYEASAAVMKTEAETERRLLDTAI